MIKEKDQVTVAIIIVNYNGTDDTLECLASLALNCRHKDFFVTLIDNNSVVSIDPIVENDYPFELIVIRNRSNIGFAGANNIGIAEAIKRKSEFIFLLNNDTIILNDIVNILGKTLDENNELGIIGAVNYQHDKPEMIGSAGFNINYRLGKNRSISDFDVSEEKIVYADYVPGSSMMIRSSVIERIGGFDDKYFAYWEEIDFCFRAKQMGFKTAFLPNSKILHKVGKSSSDAFKSYLRTRNKLYFYKRHFSSLNYFSVLLRELLVVTILSLYRLILLRPLDSFGYLLGIVDFFRGRMGAQRIDYFLKQAR